MELYRKLLILIIIVVFSYIIFRLIGKRRQLLDAKNVVSNNTSVEGLSMFATPESELNAITIVDPSPGISNFDTTKSNLPLNQYIIKASYNTPFTGSFVNLDSIKYVLSRGCRFIDLEVYLIDNKVCVAQSTEPDNITIDSQNTLLLDDVLKCIVLNAFTAPSPNPLDPLFLQLRIKTDEPNIYKYSAMAIDHNLKNKLYHNTKTKNLISNSTKIGDLMGKIVLIIDKTVAPNYNKTSECTGTTGTTGPTGTTGTTDLTSEYCLNNYVNIISGTTAVRPTSYTDLLDQYTKPPIINNDGKTVDVSFLRIVSPGIVSSNTINPDVNPFIKKYGAQIICYQYWKKDSNLENYELLFSDNKSAFVPIATFLQMKIKSVDDSTHIAE